MNDSIDSIDPMLLTAVTGGGPSLGDRSAPAESPNPWSGSMNRAATANANGYRGAIDPQMSRQPENPNMDAGMWQQPAFGTYGGNAASSQSDI